MTKKKKLNQKMQQWGRSIGRSPSMTNESNGEDRRDDVRFLFDNVVAQREELNELLERVESHWGGEDPIYRFYHQSFKVYDLQQSTLEIVHKLQGLSPSRSLNPWFLQIVSEGTGRAFQPTHNSRWLSETRPILEAFFHARFFLSMAVKYSTELKHPPRVLPSGWAALLYLYDLR